MSSTASARPGFTNDAIAQTPKDETEEKFVLFSVDAALNCASEYHVAAGEVHKIELGNPSAS